MSYHAMRRRMIAVATVLVSLTLPPVVTADPATETQPVNASDRMLINELADGFEALFTEALSKQPDGQWEVDPRAANQFGLTTAEAQQLASFMQASVNRHATTENRDLVSYGECVVANVSPLPMAPSDAADIGQLLANRQWQAAAEKVAQVASLNGATDLLRYGINAIGGVPAFVGKLALYASSCLVNEQLD